MVVNSPEIEWWRRALVVRQVDEFPDNEVMAALGLTENSSIADFQDRLLWGTYGRPACYPVRWKKLRDLDTEHLENILVGQWQIPLVYSRAILGILRERHALGMGA